MNCVGRYTLLTQLSLTYPQYSFYNINFDFAPLITTLSHFKDRSKVPRCLPSAQIRQRFQPVPSFPINSLNQLTRRRPVWRGARREMAAIQYFRSRRSPSPLSDVDIQLINGKLSRRGGTGIRSGA